MKSFFLNIPYQKSYCIAANERMASIFKAYFGECFSYHNSKECLHYSIEAIDDSHFSIYTDSDNIMVKSPISYFNRIISNNFSKATGTFTLHAASIVYDDRAYILVAPSGTGKTTLTAYLCGKGLKYINDDCAIIDMTNLSVQPYTIPLRLREDSLNILSKSNIDISNFKYVSDGYIHRFVRKNTNPVNTPVPIEKIFFLFRKCDENFIRDTPPEMAITMLMKSTVCSYSFGKAFWEAIFKISNSIKAHTILYSDMDFVCHAITDYIPKHSNGD